MLYLTHPIDASKFGTSYLSKFGWDASQGLGMSGEGRTDAIKVAQKLDMFGIGAAQQKDPNGIAWKQNKDYENLLRRLNESVETTPVPESAGVEEKENGDDTEDGKSEKKRKRKEGGEDKKEKKKQRKEGKETESKESTPPPVSAQPTKVVIPRHRG